MSKENCGQRDGSVSRLRAMNTRCGSWATPIAATWERPARAAASRYGCITSMLRSAALSGTTGMWLASAKEATRRRNASPICCRQAPEGIMVCSAGRASSYLTTVAAALGLHIRVGMEDTVWRWPHRPEKLESNISAFESAKTLATLLGRDIASFAQFRELMHQPPKH